MSDLSIPTEMIPALRTFATALSIRLGCELNYAQAYIVLTSAQASGVLDTIGCREFHKHAANPKLIETIASLLEQHPELLDELQSKAKLQGF